MPGISLTKSFLIYGIGNMLYALIVLLLIPVYLEKLNVADYGKFSILYVTGNLFSIIFSFSISNGILRYFSEFDAVSLRRSAVSTMTVFFLLTFLVVFVFFNLLPDSLNIPNFSSQADRNNVFVVLLWGFTRVLFGMILGALRALEKPVKYVSLTVADVIILCVVNLYIMFFTSFGVENILVGYLISSTLSIVIGFGFLSKFLTLDFNKGALKYLLMYGLPLSVANVVSYLIAYGNRYFLVFFSNTEDVAIFDVAQKITGILSIVLVNAFMISFTPYYLRMYNTVSIDEFKRQINAKISTFVSMFFLLAMLLVFVDAYLLNYLSKKEYLEAALYTPFLIIANSLSVLFMLLAMTTNINKKTSIEMLVTIATLITGLIGSYILIQKIGLLGAALCQILMSLTSFVLINIYNKKYFPLDYKFPETLGILLFFIMFSVADRLIFQYNLNLFIAVLSYAAMLGLYVYIYRRNFDFIWNFVSTKYLKSRA